MIEAALFNFLTTDPAIAALIGTRLFPGVAPDTAPKPFAIYQKISGSRSLAHGGEATLSSARIQIDCYAKTHSELLALANAICLKLHGKTWSSGSIAVHVGQLENEAYSYLQESFLHRADLDFTFSYGVI